MKKIAIPLFVLIHIFVLLLSCDNRDNSIDSFDNSKFNAEIIGFVPEKCYCCWGWEIKVGDKIIKADALPDASAIGYEITQPIPVIIKTGDMKINCGNGSDYYEIKSLTIK
jgi:hypothetical protein